MDKRANRALGLVLEFPSRERTLSLPCFITLPKKGAEATDRHTHTQRDGRKFLVPFQFAKVIKFRFPLLHPCDQIPRKVLRVHPNFSLAVQLEDVVFANVAA